MGLENAYKDAQPPTHQDALHKTLDNMSAEIREMIAKTEAEIARLTAEREAYVSLLQRINPPAPQPIGATQQAYTNYPIGGLR